mmetsp:Transcript_4365/g.11422  ORF Transcript_4365/g.11422 Transcript_4365/m.11422 type:complete len:212 (-) Transcript_4365:1343-1978(-)
MAIPSSRVPQVQTRRAARFILPSVCLCSSPRQPNSHISRRNVACKRFPCSSHPICSPCSFEPRYGSACVTHGQGTRTRERAWTSACAIARWRSPLLGLCSIAIGVAAAEPVLSLASLRLHALSSLLVDSPGPFSARVNSLCRRLLLGGICCSSTLGTRMHKFCCSHSSMLGFQEVLFARFLCYCRLAQLKSRRQGPGHRWLRSLRPGAAQC